MSTVLRDTMVFSWRLPQLATAALRERYERDLRNHTLVISFQTLGEVLQGAALNGCGERRRAALHRILGGVEVLYPDETTVKGWSTLRVHAQRIGRRLEATDAWIAAVALRWNIPLVTHDRDFVGLQARAPSDLPRPVIVALTFSPLRSIRAYSF